MSVQNLYNRLKPVINNDYGVFGLIGNIGWESSFSPINLQNTGNSKLGMTDEAYTKAVDTKQYTKFAKDSLGYGLCQWTSPGRKQALLNKANLSFVSIGDENMQIDFLIEELTVSYKSVLNKLKNAKDLREATDVVMKEFERPKDQSEKALEKRLSIAQTWYYNIIGGGKVMRSRAEVVNLVNSWIGKKESDGSFKSIIDTYNSYEGVFPRGTKMQYNWAWCACTWSALAIKLGYTDIMPIEISCYYLIEKAKSMGIWKESDAFVPKPGDAVLYDWDDNGIGDCNGSPDHIGTVVEVNGSQIVVVEGNYSNAVKKRTINVNGRYIRGYITPKYTEDGTINKPTSTIKKSVDVLAREVIAGSWGTGSERKKRLEAEGYNYNEVQKRVNEILNDGATKPVQNTPKPESNKAVTANEYAQSKDASISGSYKVKAKSGLYLRYGAGTNKKAMTIMPEGTKCNCYGYYSMVGSKKWFYVQTTLDGVKYTGFCSSEYLVKG